MNTNERDALKAKLAALVKAAETAAAHFWKVSSDSTALRAAIAAARGGA